MKKTFLTAFAALLVAIPAVQAQKVNKSGLLTKIEKSDADIADAKKNAKASTWINRGKALYEAAVEPTKSLFVNMDAAMLKLAVGEPSATKQVTLLNVPYEAWEYPYFIAYIKDGKVVTWTQTDWVLKEAPAMAIEAYNKAYEIDPKSAAKAKDGLQQISDFCSQVGNTGIDTGEYVAAADAYATAFRAQSSPAYGAAADPALLYYAGYLRTVDGSAHPSSFGQGAEYLKKAIDLGYTDEEGNIYYYLFHCYYGLKNVSQDNVMLAKDALITGIGKFPKNERILDGLMQLYTAEEGVGDPADLVTLIDSAIADNPENVDLWFGRGRIFYALKNYDESIRSQLLPGRVLHDQGRRDEQGDEREAVQQPDCLRYRPEGGECGLYGGGALVRKGIRAEEGRRQHARLPQVDLLPPARRGGYDGQVQQVQYPAQGSQRRRVIPCGGGAAALRLQESRLRNTEPGFFMRRCACRDVRAVEFVG